MTPPWRVDAASGPAAQLLDPPAATERAVRFLTPLDRAVVLGSTQADSHIDGDRAAAAGVAVLRRASGGGAVLVGPGRLVWVDVVIPAGDELWTADVGRAFWWLGEAWVAALAAAGVEGAAVWRGGLVRSAWSDRICFAGLGAGEVTVGSAKVVGLSQRRTRAGAQFQCAVLTTWEPSEYLELLALDTAVRRRGAVELAATAAGVGAEVAARLPAAFRDCLP